MWYMYMYSLLFIIVLKFKAEQTVPKLSGSVPRCLLIAGLMQGGTSHYAADHDQGHTQPAECHEQRAVNAIKATGATGRRKRHHRHRQH